MNNNIIISADCTCDLPESLIQKYSIQIVPFYITTGDARFQDYTEVNASAIIEYLENEDEKISSMPASAEEYKEFFRTFSENESKPLIHISISGKISDAYSRAAEAAKGMKNVYVIDSEQASHGMGLFVLAAAYFAERMGSVEEILDELKKIQSKINCSFILKTTRHIANNKRTNQSVSNLLDLFKIKPIIKIKGGRITVGGIFIGSRASYAKKYIETALKNKKAISNTILFITVSGCSEELRQLIYREATKEIKWERVYIQDASATNLCNIGPGSIGVMFYNK